MSLRSFKSKKKEEYLRNSRLVDKKKEVYDQANIHRSILTQSLKQRNFTIEVIAVLMLTLIRLPLSLSHSSSSLVLCFLRLVGVTGNRCDRTGAKNSVQILN
jgi:hypothetical protein